MQNKPRILVLASGKKTGGGSGFQELVEFSRTKPPALDAEIVRVVSNHQDGGVSRLANELGIEFIWWPGPEFSAQGYQELVRAYKIDFIMCSGWLKYVRGLNPGQVINIHPGPTKGFGGPGFYGHHVHEAVIKAYRDGKITQSAVTMHFVTEEGPADSKQGYDRGPVFFQLPVLIRPNDTAATLAARVNEKERSWQAFVLNLVVHGLIRLTHQQASWVKSSKSGACGNKTMPSHLIRETNVGWRVVYENGLDKIIPH